MDEYETWCNDTFRGKPKHSRETWCPSQIPKTCLGSNPGLRGDRAATNRQSHGTASCFVWYMIYLFTAIGYHLEAVVGKLVKKK